MLCVEVTDGKVVNSLVFKNILFSLGFLTIPLLLFPPSLCSFLTAFPPFYLPFHHLSVKNLLFQDATLVLHTGLFPESSVIYQDSFASFLLIGWTVCDFISCNGICPFLSCLHSSKTTPSPHGALGSKSKKVACWDLMLTSLPMVI